MNLNKAYDFFEKIIEKVSQSIGPFVKENKLEKNIKTDETGCRTLVTNIDKYIDRIVSKYAKQKGINIISEEGDNEIEILRKGDYFIFDSIDGTLAAAKHVESSTDLKNPNINKTLGPEYNYTFLGAIIENGQPKFGVCYDYVSGETILLNSENIKNLVWMKSSKENYLANNALYLDNRFRINKDKINIRLINESDETFWYSSPGKAFILAQLCGYKSVAISHFFQQNGLWDIAPACIITNLTETKILDGFRNPIKFNKYLLIPGKGNTLYKGDKFSWLEKNN